MHADECLNLLRRPPHASTASLLFFAVQMPMDTLHLGNSVLATVNLLICPGCTLDTSQNANCTLPLQALQPLPEAVSQQC